MKVVWFLGAILAFSTFAHGDDLKFDVRCFTHDGGRSINIKFATSYISDGSLNVGYVQYGASKKSILLSFVGAEERVLSDDRPSEVTTIWKEVLKTKFGGEYRVVSQGANIYGFSYKSSTGKVTDFAYNSSAVMPGYTGCNWN